MRQPELFVDKNNSHQVCKLLKTLYGLKQAPREWYEAIMRAFVAIGLTRSDHDQSVLWMTCLSLHLTSRA